MELREYRSYEEEEYAECSYCNTSGANVATLEVNAGVVLKLHFCEECLKKLRRDIDKKLEEVSHWCCKCKHYEPNKYGCFKYGGHCKFEPITQDCHAHDSTCERFELKSHD